MQIAIPPQVLPKLTILPQTQALLQSPQTTLLISISGGKDSDAMSYILLALREQYRWQCAVKLMHCDMGQMEWRSTPAYVQDFAQPVDDLPLTVVRHETGDLLAAIRQLMRERPDVPPFPSAKARYCTSTSVRPLTALSAR